MKTNFEKFKEDLTLEKAINLINYNCPMCPCQKECGNDSTDHSPCGSFLKKWFKKTEDNHEQVILRANILGGMNSYIINLGDEDILETWLLDGVPDGCTEEELMEIAEDKTEFERITYLFGNMVCHW